MTAPSSAGKAPQIATNFCHETILLPSTSHIHGLGSTRRLQKTDVPASLLDQVLEPVHQPL